MDLSDKRVLLVNDDGIDAPGLAILERAVRSHTNDVCVIAPATNQSGKSRATSYGCDVSLRELGSGRYQVYGTPSDCILIGLCALGAERKFDLILSGVNDGANVADDIAASGTIGACLQGASLDVPGIAISQHWGAGKTTNWYCCETMLADLLPRLTAALSDPRGVLNVNFPVLDHIDELAGIRVVKTGWRLGPDALGERRPSEGNRVFHIQDLREDLPNERDCDLDMLIRGFVTITPLTLDQTDYDVLDVMQARLATEVGS